MAELEARKLKYPNTETESLLMGIFVEHAAVAVDEKLYGVGGSRNGRYLSDVQVFDLKSLVWSNLKLKPNADEFEKTSSLDILPAILGHNVVNWGNKLFLIGGHSKKVADKRTVLFINLETHLCSVVETSGKVPVNN